MSVVAIIPAREGSKGLPGKNIIEFLGRPLIAWTIAAAQAAAINRIVVTTNSIEIASIARGLGAEALARPPDLADDQSPMLPVVQHALRGDNAAIAVLLQPTSPLRSPEDIGGCIAKHRETDRPVVSVTLAKPWLFSLGEGGTVAPLVKLVDHRQASQCVLPNGAVYVASADALRAGGSWWDDPVGYIMPVERSVDIDTRADLDLALFYAGKANLKI